MTETLSPVAPGMIYSVERMWLLRPFRDALAKRSRETVLLEQLSECVANLWRNPRSPGLNVEQIAAPKGIPVLSARITQKYRLVLAQLGARQIGLLYFDNHDEAYAWVDRNSSRIPTMLERVEELAKGKALPIGLPMPVPARYPDDHIVLQTAEEFAEMVSDGIERYLCYLSDEQQKLVELSSRGLQLIKGGAGTGKTAVAVHKVAALLRQPDLFNPKQALYLCFNRVLMYTVTQLLDTLFEGAWPPGAEVTTLHHWCLSYLGITFTKDSIDDKAVEQLFYREFLAIRNRGNLDALDGVSPPVIWDEIAKVIKGCGIGSLEGYQAFNREGRGFVLKQRARESVWHVYEELRRRQYEERLLQWADIPVMALAKLESDSIFQPYRVVVVDEGQDFSPAMLRLARVLAGGEEGRLIVLADPAQDIYDSGFKWAQRELKIPGGSIRWLRRNFRNSAQVYALARCVMSACPELETELAQVDPPVRTGPLPQLLVASDLQDEVEEVCGRVAAEMKSETRRPQYVAVLCPTTQGLVPFAKRLGDLGVPIAHVTRDRLVLREPTVKLVTMASAKGLDFPVVYLVQVTKDALGGAKRANDPTTRRQLYTALTRSSDRLTIATVHGNHHPLLESLDSSLYEPIGSHGRAFANLYGDTEAV